jgi:hypothetical protein
MDEFHRLQDKWHEKRCKMPSCDRTMANWTMAYTIWKDRKRCIIGSEYTTVQQVVHAIQEEEM